MNIRTVCQPAYRERSIAAFTAPSEVAFHKTSPQFFGQARSKSVWSCLVLMVASIPSYFFGGLIMIWAPAVPGYISHGPGPDVVVRPVDSGVAKGT